MAWLSNVLMHIFLCFGRMSSPPLGLVQWLSDITSNPHQDRGMQCLDKGSPQNGGAPSRQLHRGIEPRLHKLRQKKTKSLKQRQSAHYRNKATRTVDQLRTPSARKSWPWTDTTPGTSLVRVTLTTRLPSKRPGKVWWQRRETEWTPPKDEKKRLTTLSGTSAGQLRR